MNLEAVSELLKSHGIEHKFVEGRAKPIIRSVPIRFKNSAERARLRKLRKKWELKNKSKLKLKRKRYEMKMKTRKPNPILSKRAKQVAKKYKGVW